MKYSHYTVSKDDTKVRLEMHYSFVSKLILLYSISFSKGVWCPS